jgi:hypothetical protein
MANSLDPPQHQRSSRKSHRSQGLPPLPADGFDMVYLCGNSPQVMPLAVHLDAHMHMPNLVLAPQRQMRESAAPTDIPPNIIVAPTMPARTLDCGASHNYYDIMPKSSCVPNKVGNKEGANSRRASLRIWIPVYAASLAIFAQAGIHSLRC